MSYKNIPEELKELLQWVNWKSVNKGGKILKIPMQPSGKPAKTTDPKTWSDFAKVVNASSKFSGIGFVFSKDDPFVGIDFDHCLNGVISPNVQTWLNKFNSYTEISQSGGGIHIIVKGELSTTGKNNHEKGFEVYDRGRYFIFTGNAFEDVKPIAERQKEVDEFLNEYFPVKELPEQPTQTPGNDFEKVIQMVDLKNYVEKETGQVFNKNNRMEKCPFCSNPNRFSYDEKLNIVKCFGDGCFNGGDVIEFVMQFHNYNKSHALRYIADTEGIRLSAPTRKTETKRATFDPSIEAELFKKDRHIIFHNENLKQYSDGFYKAFPDRYFLNLLTEQLQYFNSRQAKAKETLEVLKNSLADPKLNEQINPNPYIINCKNGLFDIREMELKAHTPTHISTFQINAKFDPTADFPRFDRFLSEILIKDNGRPDLDLSRIIQEFIGFIMFADIPFHKALIFYGEGSNGKSVLVDVLEHLFNGCTSNVHFEIIGTDVFATADLSDSLLNLSAEIGAKAYFKDNTIKQIISGDEIRAQRKNQNAFNFKPVAKHILTANNLPYSADKSFAFFRRFLIIPFNQTFLSEIELRQQPEEIRDSLKVENPHLIDELRDEADGIFYWALEGLNRLLKNKGFTKSDQVQELGKVFKIRSASVETFITEMTEFSSDGQILFSDGFKQYIEFCKKYKIPALTNRRFSNELKNQGFLVERGTDSKTFIKGISWKNENYRNY